MAVLQQLEADGPSTGLCARLRARALPIAGMTVSGPDGTAVTAEYPPPVHGLSISRSDFDLMLIERAAACGVEVVEGVRVLAPVVEQGRVRGVRAGSDGAAEWRAGVVIIADGRGSRLAASLGLSRFARGPRRWAFGCYFENVAAPGRTHGEMHLREHGYIGVSPLPDGLTNVCVVRTLAGAGSGRVSQDEVVTATLAADPWLRARFESARPLSPVVALGPLAVDASGAGVPGALLAGDAGGFVDPMTGDGLRFALRGGVLAAHHAAAELATGRPAFRQLARARQREFARKWRVNRALRWMTGSPAALNVAAMLTARWSAPVRLIVREAGDVRYALPPEVGATAGSAREPSGAW
jgi:flavin-dependent dehydrogenase